jgi:hypothetical protein
MNQCQRKHTYRFLDGAAIFAAVLISLTFLHQRLSGVSSRQAVWLPVLQLGGLATTPPIPT